MFLVRWSRKTERASEKSRKPLLAESEGFSSTVGIPPFFRRFATSGTSPGTLRAVSLTSVYAPAHGVCRAVNPLHFYPRCFFRRGQGTPPYAGLSCERSGWQATGRSGGLARFSLSFSIFYISVTFLFLGATRPGFCGFWFFFGGFSMFATRRCFGLFSTFLGCFMWTYPV